jgi:hydrogenase maturation protease
VSETSSVLIICYGNPLRSDDGVAWHAARKLEQTLAEHEAEVVCIHQLVPELAETASRFSNVIFVDAAAPATAAQRPTGHIKIEELPRIGQEKTLGSSHSLSPFTVVSMAAQFYGTKLRAFTVTVTGEHFEHGESLSVPVAAALPDLVAQIESLARSCAKENS